MRTHGTRIGAITAALAVAASGLALAVTSPNAVGAATASTVLADTSSAGQQPTAGANDSPVITPDGRFVVFRSASTALVAGDTNGQPDIFRKDLVTGAITRVSVGASGQANGASSSPDISDDGRYVAFASSANNLVSGDTNEASDVFIRDLVAGTTVRIQGAGGQPDGPSTGPDLDGLGAKVAFTSEASNLGGGAADTNGVSDVFLVDRDTDGDGNHTNTAPFVRRVTSTLSTPNLPGRSEDAVLSSDGEFVGYTSYNVFVAGDPVASPDGYVWAANFVFGPTSQIVSVDADGEPVPGYDLAMNADATWLAYTSPDVTVAGPSAGGHAQVYARVREPRSLRRSFTGPAVWVSEPASGVANGPASEPAISADGSTIAFTSAASNLSSTPDTNGRPDVYASSLHIGGSGPELVSVDATGAVSSGPGTGSGQATLSAGGRVVAMTTTDILVVPDMNPASDIAVRTRSLPIGSMDVVTVQPSHVGEEFRGVHISQIGPSSMDLVTDEMPSAPLARITLGTAPLARIPLARIDLVDTPLARIPLARIPLARIGGWPAALAGTPFEDLPLESISLEDLLAYIDANPGSTLASITLEELDLRDSPLARIAVSSVALAGIPLARIPLDESATTPAQALAQWCAELDALGQDCAALGVDANTTVVALDLAGVPLARIPLARIPLARIDIAGSPLARIPLARIVLEETPLARIPLARILLADTPLARIPLARIPLARIASVVDCSLVDCANGTLEDALAAGALVDGAELGDLIGAFGTGADELLLEDLHPYLPDDFTFGDLLLSLIDPADYPWESIPLDALRVQQHNDGADEIRALVTASVDDPGNADTLDATLEIDVLEGTRLSDVGGWIIGPGGREVVLEPTQQRGTQATFAFDDLPNGSVIALEVRTTSGLVLTEGQFTARFVVDDEVVAESRDVSTVEDPDSEGFYDDDDDTPADIGSDSEPNVLYYGWIPEADDVDYHRIPAPPAGMQTVVHVSAVAGDLDVGVFQASTPAPLNGASADPIGLGAVPLSDTQPAGGAPGAVSADPGNELQGPDSEGLTYAGGATADGFVDESLTVTSTEADGADDDYLVRVAGYDGATSNRPYVLRYRYVAVPGDIDCPARTLPGNGGTTGVIPGALPAGVNTLFLVNQDRLGDTYGASAAAGVMADLTTLAGRGDLGVVGAVIPVDGDAGVRAAYAAWDQQPCSTSGANGVVGAISSLVGGLLNANPGALDTVTSIVLVGADDTVPFARVPDTTREANESDYAFDLLAADGSATPLSAAAATKHLLSDDPYGDRDPIPWLDRFLYVPDVALGRLVETPNEIRASIAQFLASGGVLDADTALTTGYDFLSDGARAVDAALGRRIGAGSRTLFDESTWDRDDLSAALFPGGESPAVASINAHYDHSALLPGAADGTDFTEDDLYTTADVTSSGVGRLAGRILFTMGCHAGTSVPDVYVGADPGRTDWAQTYGSAGAIYVANTGFGLGDTAAVALSERLMALYANRLDGNLTAGDALRVAKNDYLGGLGLYTNYDEKVMMQTTFYGLPMYTLGPPTVAPQAPAPAPALSGSGSVKTASLSITPSFQTVQAPDGTTYLATDGELPQVSPDRPVVPRVTKSLSHPTETAHDALIVALQSTVEASVENSVAGVVTDSSAGEPATRFEDTAFPANFVNVTDFDGPNGAEQQLVVMPARVEGFGDVDRRERFTRTDVQVFYSNDPDHRDPRLTSSASLSPASVTFTVDASDLDEHGAPGTVTRVVVLFDTGGGWRTSNLTKTGATTWTATATVPPGTTAVRWMAQAVDGAGNVGVDSARGRMEKLSTAAPTFDPGGAIDVLYGERLRRDITITDPDSQRWTAMVDLGTGYQPVDVEGAIARLNAFPATPGEGEARMRICDDGGACTERTFDFAVHTDEVPPPTPDTTPPVTKGPNALSILGHLLGSAFSGSVTDAGSGVDTVIVTFKPLIGARITVNANLSCNEDRTSCTWTVPNPPKGISVLQFWAVDQAGNVEPPINSILIRIV